MNNGMNQKTLFLVITACLIVLSPLPSFGARPYISTESAIPVERGFTRLETGFKFDSFSSDEKLYTIQADITRGFVEDLELEAEIPFLFMRDSTVTRKPEEGLGDVRLKAKVRFLTTREENPFSLAGQLIIKLPSASETKGLGTGEQDIGILAAATKDFNKLRAHVNIGYTFAGRSPDREFRNTVDVSLACEYVLVEKIRLVAELTGADRSNRVPPSDGVVLQLLGGAVLAIVPAFQIDSSVAIGMSNTAPDYTVSLGTTYRF